MEAIAKYQLGQLVRHRLYDFRGVIYDVDPSFSQTEEWYLAIPEDVRPEKEQPFYHLFAENSDKSTYNAYVSEQNLVPDIDYEPIEHPEVGEFFEEFDQGHYILRRELAN
jgi:heat shock protein HspQ